jgi:hypothetical protein
LAGYRQNLKSIKFVNPFTDADLRILNDYLPWNCWNIEVRKNITAANAIIENLSIVDMRRERNGMRALLFAERG